MKSTLTKFFHFSASLGSGPKVLGHNYVLGVTTDALEEAAERDLESRIERGLIQKVHSRDLGDPDFLKRVVPTDENLLRVFWEVIQKEIAPVVLRSLSLERDRRTQTRLVGEGGEPWSVP